MMKSDKPLLSLVVPCFNEQETVELFYQEILKIQGEIPADLEICFVDDGSTDKTLDIFRKLKKQDSRIRYVSFSRNFGKEAALLAGLEMAEGDFVATMDVDLQDPPALLPLMLKYVTDPDDPYDCVATRRSTRKGEPPVRSAFACIFYRVINRLSETEIMDGARDYRLMTACMVQAIIQDREYNRFSKGIFSWVGFRTKWVEYENIMRSAGKTKWSFLKLLRYSVEGLLAYTTIPLVFASLLGLLFCGISMIFLVLIVGRALLFGDPVAGWPSLASIIVFIGGINMLMQGINSLYVSKIYLETKKRQIYIVKEKS